MNPIVSPWLFYLFNLADNLNCILTILTTVFGLGSAVYVIILVISLADENFKMSKEKFQLHSGIAKRIVIIFIVSSFFNVVIPSETTCYKMLAASLVTTENIDKVGHTAEDIIDFIVESVNEITDSNDDE